MLVFSLSLPLDAEIARQAAQMKLMRKLEKQALARAAKEARKQQGKLFSVCVGNKRTHDSHSNYEMHNE